MRFVSVVLVAVAIFVSLFLAIASAIYGVHLLTTLGPAASMLFGVVVIGAMLTSWVYIFCGCNRLAYRVEDFLREKVSQSNNWLARSRSKKSEGVVRRTLRRCVR